MPNTQQSLQLLIEQVNRSVIGQQHVVQALVIGLLTKGHILLEGLPGTAKTRSVKALAQAMKSSFGRVQFTPDLLPSDVTGTTVYREVDGKPSLSFEPGPIFNDIVLADEINRAPAKVQSALLEAMAEGTLTVANQTHQLPELFMVLATQNPIEQEGTYPLPEAQMDRFMMKVTVDYPDRQAELDIVKLVRGEESPQSTAPQIQISPAEVLTARAQLQTIYVSDLMLNYMVGLVMASRHPEQYSDTKLAEWLAIGASPRASIALDKCARAHAWLAGRDHVDADDVRAVAHAVLGHRMMLSFDAIADGVDQRQVVDELLNCVVIGQ
ncbi:hypothetical protein SIN8267_02691 [Sinobacterium norvegicum]|uniref:Uncharacterized protein n=1 Tax=Sinobacterium norvegicum TaxID=1641715 RepID=A0ABM9AHF3_9GAMM|nr:MoxR family ATPase [Sinobacterium norvegicum]CAH0992558.1 hypothetical protein SIN8267_02691 [Sinobacterium norvegicum]